MLVVTGDSNKRESFLSNIKFNLRQGCEVYAQLLRAIYAHSTHSIGIYHRNHKVPQVDLSTVG